MIKLLFPPFFVCVCVAIATAQNNQLEKYVAMGLESNLTLKQNNMSLEKAEYALKIARGMFLPEAKIESRYSLAHGGRSIDLPIGDLLNQVYSTLNQMLAQQGQSAGFPTIANQQIMFRRPQEYDAGIKIVQPIYSRSLQLNKKITGEQINMSKLELDKFKRQLCLQIKEAYYNYLKTLQLKQMVIRTEEVVEENFRVTQKLFDNNMATRDAVLRAKSDISQIKLFETQVYKNNILAQNYFNFLLNRNMDTEIIIEELAESQPVDNINSLTDLALNEREELRQIDIQTRLYDYFAKINSAENLPLLALAVNAGLQGEEFNRANSNSYIMGSLVLNWTLFKGNINSNKRQQALIDKQKLAIQKEQVEQQIMLEIKRNFLDVQEQQQNLVLAKNRNDETQEVFRIIDKQYRMGEAALIELLDARNNMVEAESALINSKYNLLISIARLKESTVSDL